MRDTGLPTTLTKLDFGERRASKSGFVVSPPDSDLEENSGVLRYRRETAKLAAMPVVTDDPTPPVADTSFQIKLARGYAETAKGCYLRGNYQDAETAIRKALILFREMDDLINMAWCLNNAGKIAYRQGDFAHGRLELQESVALFRMLDDEYGLGWSLYNLSRVAYREGCYEEANRHLAECMPHFRNWGDRPGIAWTHNALARVAYQLRDYDTARLAITESLALFQELDDIKSVAWSQENLGQIAYKTEDYTEARQRYAESLETYGAIKDRSGVAWSYLSTGKTAFRQGYYREADTCVHNARSLFNQLSDIYMEACCMEYLARIAYHAEDYEKSAAHLEKGIFLFSRTDDVIAVRELRADLEAVNKQLSFDGADAGSREAIGHDRPSKQAAAASPEEIQMRSDHVSIAAQTTGQAITIADVSLNV